jgi:uncharacterized protein YwqG
MLPSEEDIEADARPALLIRRTDLPAPLDHPTLSYFGGLPKLPPDVEWPRAEVAADVEEETVALTFVAQIDVSELPQFEGRSLLPEQGTLFFFCSSAFEGESNPPCSVLYHPESAAAFPQRQPPPDLMPLAGEGGDYQAKWLKKETDLYSCVEFKYPVSFLPFNDYSCGEDSAGEKLLQKSLCDALGPSESNDAALRTYAEADVFAKDEDWPFNWQLVVHVVRSIIDHLESDLRGDVHWKPMKNESREMLPSCLAGAKEWLKRAASFPPFDLPDQAAKESFRSWWTGVVHTYKKLGDDVLTYAFLFPNDLQNAIAHNVKLLAVHSENMLARAPRKYVSNFQRQNRWVTPSENTGVFGRFSIAIHQMLGYGVNVQGAPEERIDSVLLLQLQGDDVFFPWHDNGGCVLQLWIERDALLRRDFSDVEATLECD